MLWCVVGRHATSSGKHSRVAEPWQDSIDCVAWQKVETFVYHRCETAVVSSRQTYWDQGWQRPPSNYNMPERNSESVMKVKRDIIGSQYLRVNLCLMISPGLLLRCGHDCAKCLLGVGRSCNELIFLFVYITAPSHTAQFGTVCCSLRNSFSYADVNRLNDASESDIARGAHRLPSSWWLYSPCLDSGSYCFNNFFAIN